MNARIKVLRPGSRESNISINSVSKVSVRTNLVAEPDLSRNTSIQSIGPNNPKMVFGQERRTIRFGDTAAGGFLGQNTTV